MVWVILISLMRMDWCGFSLVSTHLQGYPKPTQPADAARGSDPSSSAHAAPAAALLAGAIETV